MHEKCDWAYWYTYNTIRSQSNVKCLKPILHNIHTSLALIIAYEDVPILLCEPCYYLSIESAINIRVQYMWVLYSQPSIIIARTIGEHKRLAIGAMDTLKTDASSDSIIKLQQKLHAHSIHFQSGKNKFTFNENICTRLTLRHITQAAKLYIQK